MTDVRVCCFAVIDIPYIHSHCAHYIAHVQAAVVAVVQSSIELNFFCQPMFSTTGAGCDSVRLALLALPCYKQQCQWCSTL